MSKTLIFLKRALPFFILFLTPCLSMADIKKIENKISSSIDTEIKTQKINEKWETEKNILKNEYEQLSYNNKNLKKRKESLEKILSFQKQRQNEFLRKQKEVKRIKTELDSLLSGVVLELENFIKRDLPFHKEERLARIEELKNELLINQSDPADKYRQVFETLQIETDYGKEIEVYKENISIDNNERLMEVLRIGRLSLFSLTPDKKIAGKYDPAMKKWVELSSKDRKEIEKGILTAKGEKTAEFVKLSLGRLAK